MEVPADQGEGIYDADRVRDFAEAGFATGEWTKTFEGHVDHLAETIVAGLKEFANIFSWAGKIALQKFTAFPEEAILMVQASAKSWTLEAFLQLPETKPASEYLDGQIIQKPMPQGKHSAIQTELSGFINRHLKTQQVARAFCELRCTFGGRSTVPDIAVFEWERIVRDEDGTIANTFKRAPNWTIKILSPAQSQTKVTKNILHCLRYGTQMGWLIDPAEKTVFVYSPKREIQVFDEPTAKLPIPFALLELSLGDLFGWLQE